MTKATSQQSSTDNTDKEPVLSDQQKAAQKAAKTQTKNDGSHVEKQRAARLKAHEAKKAKENS